MLAGGPLNPNRSSGLEDPQTVAADQEILLGVLERFVVGLAASKHL